MTQPVALYMQDARSIRDAMDHVQYAEERGFDAVWQADSRLVREVCVPMAAFRVDNRHHQDRQWRG